MNKLFGALAVLWLLGTVAHAQDAAAPAAVAPAETAAQVPAAAPKLTADQLDDLCGPVALYPDSLLAQILIASAYPLDVVQAARWAEANKDKNLTPDALEAALKDKAWDASVKVLIGFPSVLKQLDQNLDWTTALGDAFVNQQADVMESIQVLRAQAKAVGNLDSGKEQTVTVTAENDITIEPTDPEKIYVPQYTAAVYEAAPAAAPATGGTTVVAPEGSTVVTQGTTTVVTTPAEPAPYPTAYASAYPTYSSGAVVASGLLGFGAGMLVGSLIWNDNMNWNNHYVSHYGYGDYGWGGNNNNNNNNCKNCGNKNSNNNINIGEVNINTGNRVNAGNNVGNVNGKPWQPNAQRRPAQTTGLGATTRPAATTTAGGRGYGSGGAARPTAASVQSALGQGGGALNTTRGNDARREAERGRQSLQNSPAKPVQAKPGTAGSTRVGAQQPAVGTGKPNAGRPAAQKPVAGAAKPDAGRPQGGTLQQPAVRPAQANAGRAQGQAGSTRTAGQGTGGRTPSAFAVGNGNADRAAGQRGQASRQSATTQRQQGGQRQKPQGGQPPRPQRGRG